MSEMRGATPMLSVANFHLSVCVFQVPCGRLKGTQTREAGRDVGDTE